LFLLLISIALTKKKHYDKNKNKEVITKYKVWSFEKTPTSEFSPRSCASLHNPNNYYLIDPSKPAEITNLPAPNTAHYKEWAKRGNTPDFCMPPWSYEELLAIKAHMPYNLTDIEFKTRFEYFGGRPRFIFASTLDYRRYTMWQQERLWVTVLLASTQLKQALEHSSQRISSE